MMTNNTRVLQTLLKLVLDKNTVEQVKSGTKEIDKALEEVQNQALKTVQNMNMLRETSERLGSIFTTVAGVGAAITGPMVLAVRSYVSEVQDAESVSAKWLRATDEIKESQQRIGRVATQAVLPVLEKAAEIAEKTADFAEAHPDAVKAVLYTGTAVATLGAIGLAMTRGIRIYADIKAIQAAATNFAAAKLMDNAAAKNLLAAGGSAAGSGGLLAAGGIGAALKGAGASLGAALTSPAGLALLGLGGGFLGADLLSRSSFGQQLGIQSFGKTATAAAYGVGSIFGPETAQKWAASIGRLTGAIKKADDATEKATESIAEFSEGQMQAYLDWDAAEKEAQEAYQKQRAQLIQSYQEQVSDLESSYQETRAATVQAYYENETKYQADYYRDRMKAARDHSIEMARLEEDFQDELRDLESDHNDAMRDAAERNDYLAVVREMRSYEKNRQEAEREHDKEVARRDADFAQTLADEAEQFAIQRAERMKAFQQSLKDQDAAYQKQRRSLQQSLDRQLQELDQSYKEERILRRKALIDNLNDLVEGLNAERSLRQQFTAAMLADLRAVISESGGSVPGRASGGYVGAGLYRLHDHEYVLNKGTTMAAERAVGGSLSQESLLAALANGGRGSGGSARSLQMGDVHIYGDLSASAKAALRKDVRRIFQEELEAAYA